MTDEFDKILSYDNFRGQVCPYCKSKEFVKMYRGTDGLFTSREFSHYECSNCRRKFEYPTYIITVPRDTVADIVQKASSGELNREQLRAELRKLDIWLDIYKRVENTKEEKPKLKSHKPAKSTKTTKTTKRKKK